MRGQSRRTYAPRENKCTRASKPKTATRIVWQCLGGILLRLQAQQQLDARLSKSGTRTEVNTGKAYGKRRAGGEGTSRPHVNHWEKDSDPLDYKVEMAELWGLPREDMAQFKIDWETVVDKIRSGHAEDISGSDTLYLEACTKAANSTVRTRQPFSAVPAKPRAWALKASYMTAAENKLREKRQAIVRTEAERDLGLLELVRKRFDPYFGMTEEGLCRTFGIGKRGKRTPKNACALVTKSILGVEKDAKVEEFAKAGIPKPYALSRMVGQKRTFPSRRSTTLNLKGRHLRTLPSTAISSRCGFLSYIAKVLAASIAYLM